MNKHVLLFWLFLLFVAAIAIEISLRWMGFHPGDLRPNWLSFKAVDSLYIIKQFKTGKDGILIADSTYWATQNVAINSNGFRTLNFDKIDSSKKKVLVIGDSFTWGLSANPIQDSSFCDLLSKAFNLQVINLGIPAVDPLQYSLIAQKYVSVLKPDVVFVMFFSGNDFMTYDRRVIPNSEMFYWTNAGAIAADIDGQHFADVQSAYDYLYEEKYYLKKPKSKIEYIISSSSLLSRLYALKFRVEEKRLSLQTIHSPAITLKYLYQILNLCNASKVPLRFVFIPEVKEVEKDFASKYKVLLGDSRLKENWLVPEYKYEDYKDYPDGHWNNDGHRFMAKYLEEILAGNIN
ncbi:MAG: SGNH/GDSL hydrolase family protein [Bacteroidetes bacterium]|nr:SGNH/GDSL hydrolase family protein [Bacteroidota bacterium]